MAKLGTAQVRGSRKRDLLKASDYSNGAAFCKRDSLKKRFVYHIHSFCGGPKEKQVQ